METHPGGERGTAGSGGYHHRGQAEETHPECTLFFSSKAPLPEQHVTYSVWVQVSGKFPNASQRQQTSSRLCPQGTGGIPLFCAQKLLLDLQEI